MEVIVWICYVNIKESFSLWNMCFFLHAFTMRYAKRYSACTNSNYNSWKFKQILFLMFDLLWGRFQIIKSWWCLITLFIWNCVIRTHIFLMIILNFFVHLLYISFFTNVILDIIKHKMSKDFVWYLLNSPATELGSTTAQK